MCTNFSTKCHLQVCEAGNNACGYILADSRGEEGQRESLNLFVQICFFSYLFLQREKNPNNIQSFQLENKIRSIQLQKNGKISFRLYRMFSQTLNITNK